MAIGEKENDVYIYIYIQRERERERERKRERLLASKPLFQTLKSIWAYEMTKN